ncbi:MAG: PAS domain S-box protein [Anaerolineae bacterium]|nr:PAS domain S-box protein [Anaerolineae bacterium]
MPHLFFATLRLRLLGLILLAAVPALGLVGLLALAATTFFSDTFLRQVQALVKAMQRLRAGDLSARIGLPYESEELGQLARAFDEMAKALQQREAANKRTEEALQATQARLAGIIASTMDAVITVDARQGIILFNAAAEQMFRCSAVEALGQPLDRFIPARFRDAHREHICTFGRTKVSKRSMRALGTITGLRADGQEIPLEASISQVEAARQKLYTAILRNITERQRTEQEREQLIGELNAFAHTVAHDLKNPLFILTSTAQILVTEYTQMSAEELKCNLQAMVRHGHKQNNIIGELLLLAGVRQQPIEIAPLDMAGIIAEAHSACFT